MFWFYILYKLHYNIQYNYLIITNINVFTYTYIYNVLMCVCVHICILSEWLLKNVSKIPWLSSYSCIISMDVFRHCYLCLGARFFSMRTSKWDPYFKIDGENQKRRIQIWNNSIYSNGYTWAFPGSSHPGSFYFSSLYPSFIPQHIFFHGFWLIFIFKEIHNCSWHNKIRNAYRLNNRKWGFD